MKILILRHAKSSWANQGQADYDRPLNERGQKDAPRMGRVLVENGIIPDLILCSPSQRTRETRALLHPTLTHTQTVFEDDLYHAGPREILNVLRNLASDSECALVIAHNPGVTLLVNQLTGSRIDNVPTAGLSCIDLPNEELFKAHPNGKLVYFVYPKALPK